MLPRAMRHRATTAALLAQTIALGLASRRHPAAFPAWFAEYGGDTLWAAAVFFSLRLAFPQMRPHRHATAALGIAYAVEFSQLYHAPWLDAIRATTPGALLLGQGFLPSDLACYTVGVSLALLLVERLPPAAPRASA